MISYDYGRISTILIILYGYQKVSNHEIINKKDLKY